LPSARHDKYDFSFLEQRRKPILFVHGEHDELGMLKSSRVGHGWRSISTELRGKAPVTSLTIN
jgi:hypothetical protein